MKLHLLELTGFGPFRQTQRVDFDAFDRDGVFLISGRTGAGKSSILDGVSFALYGTVPRYEGGERRLRSDHSVPGDPSEVRLTFTVGDTRWRVTRAPEYDRPAKRGGGLTTEPARAELEEFTGGAWVGRAAGPRDVGLALGEVLGLGAQQFQQVILLAQNKFSRFLLAPGEERQTLLRTLFGTRRFEQYRDDLDQRRRDAQKRLDTAAEHARTLLELAESLVADEGPGEGASGSEIAAGDLAARRDAILAAVGRAEYRVEQAVTARERAEEESRRAVADHAALAERARLLRERTAARERLAQLEARAPHIADQRRVLDGARAAEGLRASLDAVDRTSADLASADAENARTLTAWTEAGGGPGDDLATRVDEITTDLGRWTDAAAHERALGGLRARFAEGAAAASATEDLIGALAQRVADIPLRRADLGARLTDVRAVAARLEGLRADAARLEAQRDAARLAARLAPAAADAERTYLAASAAAAAAGAAVTDLLQRRLAGFAGELAAALRDGEPCAVCGSPAHPHPAAPGPDAVTEDDLAHAEQARDAADAVAGEAAANARRSRDLLAAARADAAGADVEELEPLLDAARTALAAAEEAARLADRLAREADDLDEAAADAQAAHTAALARRLTEREGQAALGAEVARAEASVADARGDHASVADRIAAGEALRSAGRAVIAARAAVEERGRAATAASADLDARLGASPFGGMDEARAAVRSAPELAALDDEIATYAADLAATRERLLELELAAVGADVTADELRAAQARVDSADELRAAAIGAERDAQNAARRLRDLSEQSDAAYAGLADTAVAARAVTRLADTVAGRAPNTMKMDLETFVLAAELEEIVAAANVRLGEMSAGRYTLHHTDARAARGRASGLGIEVLDAHTGRSRSPQSLSGGETFLASLALALGLGEVVTARAGGIRLDTLFVDEGFGSLDPETLELAMRTLDELRVGGRTVGVISHVEAMKEQLPAQVVVEATAQGPSVIRQETSALA